MTNRVTESAQLIGNEMDFVPSATLEERLKKAKKEQQDAALPASFVWPLPQQQSPPPPPPPRDGGSFKHHAEVKGVVKAGHPQEDNLRPTAELPRAASVPSPLLTGAAGKLSAQPVDGLLAMDNDDSGPLPGQKPVAAIPAGAMASGEMPPGQKPVATIPVGAAASGEMLAGLVSVEKPDREKPQPESVNNLVNPLAGAAPKTAQPAAVKAEFTAAAFSQRQPANEAPEAPSKVAAGSEGQNKISYTFTSWGSDHRVLLTTTRDISQQLSVVMNPSDPLVSRRLQDAIISHSPGAGVILREDAEKDGQQQRREQTALLAEEDE